MEPLEILQITVEKWILVVPLDLKCQRPGNRLPDVIDLVADGLALLAIYDGLYDELVLRPSRPVECVAEPHR